MADPASNLLSDALMGKPVDDITSGVSAPVASTITPDITSESTPLPSTEIPIPEKTPESVVADSLQATPVPIEPGKPVEAVSPTPVAPSTPPTAASLPPKKSGMPPAVVIAGLAILAVTTVGVGAAVVLSGESQELRQRAYVAPTPLPPVVAPSDIVVVPTGENAFIAMKNLYPNAPGIPLVTDGIRGTLYVTSGPTVTGVFFAEITGLESLPDKRPYAWITLGDGSTLQLSEILVDALTKKAYFASEQYAEGVNTATDLFITYENPESSAVEPSPQKVAHVEL